MNAQVLPAENFSDFFCKKKLLTFNRKTGEKIEKKTCVFSYIFLQNSLGGAQRNTKDQRNTSLDVTGIGDGEKVFTKKKHLDTVRTERWSVKGVKDQGWQVWSTKFPGHFNLVKSDENCFTSIVH